VVDTPTHQNLIEPEVARVNPTLNVDFRVTPAHPYGVFKFPDHFRRLQKLLLRRGRTREDSEDLIQAAFLRMQEYCHKGGAVDKPESFLVRTVLRLSLNAHRDAHAELYVHREVEDLTFLVDTNPTPDEVLESDECLERMRGALDTLPSRTRETFFMHRIEGRSYVEIATTLKVSVSAVEKHMASALAALAAANNSMPFLP
jgi:RNA polymerase sigma factor (sigma-70 family)